MVPSAFTAYFAATSGAGAALIGLLFVAVSISPERIFSRTAEPELPAVAGSAFTALVNAFFVATAALLPNTNIGYVALALGWFGVANSVTVGVQLARQAHLWRSPQTRWRRMVALIRALALVAISLAFYLWEIEQATQAIGRPHDEVIVGSLATLVLISYGFGLIRAWELLGARGRGVFGWLSPLRALDERTASGEQTALNETGATATTTEAPPTAP